MSSSPSDERRGAVESLGQLPEGLDRLLDGSDLAGRASQAFRLTTVDADGWTRGAQLSVGEVLSAGPRLVMLCLWPGTSTAGNLRRDGRCTLSCVVDEALHEVRLRALPVPTPEGEGALALFRGQVESVEVHRARYAQVTSGVTFRLADPGPALARWRGQVESMQQAAGPAG